MATKTNLPDSGIPKELKDATQDDFDTIKKLQALADRLNLKILIVRISAY